MQASFAALSAQVTALNAQLADMVNTQKNVDPSGFNRLAKAAEANSRVFRDAAASTGLFETQQVRVNSATDEYVKKLNAQKMGFRAMAQQRKIATAAYREQLAMERMMVRKNPASSMHGKDTFDVTYPKAYEAALDSSGNRLRWFNAQLKSGATQMVNWGKNTQWAGRQLMVGFTMPIAAFGAAAGVMAYKVDKEFTRIAKVYDTTADRLTDLSGWEAETAQLRADGYDTARMAAREYQAAITDTLQVQGELAATGQTGMELQKNTNEVMRIATLGELDMQTATEATIALQSIWKMSNTELAESFNYINATENATSLQTQDFTKAIPIAASAVKAFGGDLKELGILLTAMREQGINANQGANALKATMQRLGRPSKQVQQEFSKLTGESIVDLVDGSNGLIEVFTNLNHVTRDLSENDQRKVFAGLFGSYQVTRMMALTKGMGDLENGVGQVSEAARVAGMSTEEMAEVAQGEIDALQKSVSGRFKATLEEIKIIMAEMGLPFLEAATSILGALAKIGGFINDLPDLAKTLLGWAVAGAAVAGPLVMLTGLVANLGGNGLKVVAGMITAFGRFSGTMSIADKQSRIYSAAAKMAETQHLSQTRAVKDLTATMDKLVVAQVAANTASKNSAAMSQQELKWTAARSAAHKKLNAELALEQKMLAHYGRLDKNGNTILRDPAKGPMASISRANAMKGIQDVGRVTDVDAARSQALAEQQRRSTVIANAAKQEAIARDRSRVAMVGGSVAAAAMAGSMAAMMLPLGETASKIAQYTMIATIVVPAAWTLLRATTAAAMAAGVYAKNMAAGATATQAAAAASSGSLVGGLKSLITKGNVATAVVAGIGIAAFAVWKHFDNIREEQKRVDRANASLISQTERWAQSTGKVLDGYKKLAVAAKTGADTTDMTQRIEFYKSDEEKESTEAYGDMNYLEKQSVATGKFIDMVQGMGMSTKEAKKELQAFLMATGETAIGASIAVDRFTDSMVDAGAIDFSAKEWNEQYVDVMRNFNNITDGFDIFNPMDDFEKNKNYLTQLGQQGGKMFSQAFLKGTEGEREVLRTSLENQVYAPWNDIQKKIASDVSGIERENIKSMFGLDDAAVDDMLSSGEKIRSFYMSLSTDDRETFALTTNFTDAIAEAEALERVIVSGIADALGVAGKGVDTLGELFNDAAVMAESIGSRIGTGFVFDKLTGAWRASTTEMEQGIAEVGVKYEEFMGKAFDPTDLREFEAKLTELQSIDTTNMDDDEKQKIEDQKAALEELITMLYAYAQALDIQSGDTEFGQLINLMGGFQNETSAATTKVKRLDGELKNLDDVDLSIDVVVNMMQNIRGGIQESMADMMTSDFDSRMQSDIDATQTYWDNRQTALDASADKRTAALDAEMDRRSAGLDAKWEKRKDGAEKYWDARIEAVDKAMEAEEKAEERRQKMFEAEMERLDKLSDAANKNIDFNVALNSGNLDEAAKIQNDIQADSARDVLQAAADASQGSSDKKVDRLENKGENLEEQKDAAMKAMDKREQAEKAHLDKITDMRKAALQKDIEADKAALEKQSEMAIAAKEADWETKKVAFDEQMALFLAFTARNEKELIKHMESVGIGYDEFGVLLKNKGTDWSTYMGDEMQKRVRLAALELRNDAAWSQLGKGAVEQMIRSMGFKSEAAFQHFIRTGEVKDIADGENKANGADGKGRLPGNKEEGMITSHEGGEIGKGKNSRKGVAKTYKGLHPSEVMVRAQQGEFMVNKKAAQEHGPLLERLNDGKGFPNNKATARAGRGIGGGGGSLAGMIAGSVMRAAMFGVMKNIGAKYERGKAAAAAAAGAGTGSFPGKYVPGQGGWQRPSIPGLGWTNTHDYRAGEGTPVFAPSDGVITKSQATVSGGSPGNGLYATPYRSYGETIQIRMADGNVMNFGHLMPGGRYVSAGQAVKGGALIGRTGNTGNSSGPHLHMDIGGNENASGYLASRGIALAKGAANINFDNTPAILHKNEAVLTEDINRQFKQGVANFANGGNNEYTVIVNPSEGMDEEALANKVVRKLAAKDARKPQSRTIGNGGPR